MVKGYSESHRHHHNLKHVSLCLEELVMRFHDAVYEHKQSDNEEASAGYAMKALGGLIGGEPLERVHRLIMATRLTGPPRDDERIIMDVDLAILGRPSEEFQEYEDGIRKEYSWVPEERFRRGRREVLTRFLTRPSIFHTEHFRGIYAEKARTNLHRSLSRLGSLSP